MDYDKLRDEAALAAWQALLQRNEYGKEEYSAVRQIAATAWDYADAFMDNRPSKDK